MSTLFVPYYKVGTDIVGRCFDNINCIVIETRGNPLLNMNEQRLNWISQLSINCGLVKAVHYMEAADFNHFLNKTPTSKLL